MSLHTSGGPKVCVQLCTGAYRCVQVRTVVYSCVQLCTGCTQLYTTVHSSQRFVKRALMSTVVLSTFTYPLSILRAEIFMNSPALHERLS